MPTPEEKPTAEQIEAQKAYNALPEKSKKQVDTLILRGFDEDIAMSKACEYNTTGAMKRIETQMRQEKETTLAAKRGKIIASREYEHVKIDPRLADYALSPAIIKPAKIEAAPFCARI